MSSRTERVKRFGQSVEADEVFQVRTSGKLARMLSALELESNAVDRHYLLVAVVEQLYNRRKAGDKTRQMLVEVARQHLVEMGHLLAELARHGAASPGRSQEGMPVVPTFNMLSVVLCEAGRFQEAREVWRLAQEVGYMTPEGRERQETKIAVQEARYGGPPGPNPG